jgi:hypothetical protein
MTTTQTIRPGFLVALKTSVRGGVRYERQDLEATDAVKKWETTRVIADPIEHANGGKARARAATEIRRVCSSTSFGLLCPQKFEKELDDAVMRANDVVEQFNATAVNSRLSLYVLKGRIAETDEAAARAIASEVRDLIDGMREGIEALDVERVRDSANRARQMAAVLGDEQQERVGKAVEAARAAARAIVRRIEKKGEDSETVLADIDTGPILAARMAFLDLDDTPAEPCAPMPAVELQRVADLMDDEVEVAIPVAIIGDESAAVRAPGVPDSATALGEN